MATDEIKALLLEDYRHCSAGMAKSEQAGETRINLFIGLITFCGSAIGAGYAKLPPIDHNQLHKLTLGVTLALSVIGFVILLRMISRNENTDLAKRQLDLIRQTFKDRFDDSRALTYYDLFPPSGGRKPGGLTDLVAVVNGILIAGAFLFSFLSFKKDGLDEYAIAAAVSAFFICFMAQREYVRTRVEDYKNQHNRHFQEFTHAGGVVHTVENGTDCYLLVRPKNLKEGKDEWVLPQGHIEPREGPGPRESHSEAALREVYEETGVIAQLRGVIGSEQFIKSDELQIVKFYLMEKIVDAAAEENRKTQWFSLANALENFEKLNYKESIRILRTAERLRLQAVSNNLPPARPGNQ